MNKIHSIASIFLLVIFSGCEEVGVTYPGNTQNLDPQPPVGGIDWAEGYEPIEDGGPGRLEENSAAGLTIGTLKAVDPNPDDEFTYSISSQMMDNTAINYFVLNSNSGVTNLELSNGSINFEALTGSKQVDVNILVSDDSPSKEKGDFTVSVKIINVNETPFFTNLNQIPRYADLDKKIQQLDNFFTTATDEEIRKALQPPNDMGKFAEKALKDILLEKNKQDNRFTGGLPPDTEARKNNEIIQEQEKQLSEEEKAAMAKKAAEAKKKAAEQTNEAMKSVQPAKSLEFKQQNFLQAKLLDIIRHRRAPGSPDSIPPQKTYPYVEGAPNSSIMLFGDPATTVNDLFVYPDTETFFQMRTEEISALQPEIRFFKAITDSESGKEVNVPIHFDTSLTSNSLESLLVSRKKRGTGVGLQEFKLGFVGVDVFSANKAFTADTIDLTTNNTSIRGTETGGTARNIVF